MGFVKLVGPNKTWRGSGNTGVCTYTRTLSALSVTGGVITSGPPNHPKHVFVMKYMSLHNKFLHYKFVKKIVHNKAVHTNFTPKSRPPVLFMFLL